MIHTTTVFTGVRPSDGLRRLVQEQAADLAQDYPFVSSCRVAIEGSIVGGPHHVRIALAARDDAIFVAAQSDSDEPYEGVPETIARAFDRAHMRLDAIAARVVMDEIRMTGAPYGDALVNAYPRMRRSA
jgi:hypothetical protein